jgi:L-2,4-diaminobutyric acid acetyltransferase
LAESRKVEAEQSQKNESTTQEINELIFSEPTGQDGPAVTQLIQDSPPLDTNSAYCNLLQCTHFAKTCIVAKRDSTIVGWISAYIPPDEPNQIFIWQVAVHDSMRGKGLAKQMLNQLLARPNINHVQHLCTTITKDNIASWSLFKSIAKSLDIALNAEPHFDKEAHFNGAHDTEWMVTLGPFK